MSSPQGISNGRTLTTNGVGGNILSMVVMLCFYIAVCTAEISDVSEKAHAEYSQGHWQAASDLYRAIEPKGPGVWYNLGNCYYRMNDCAQAVACWKRGQKGSSLAECADCMCNIECAQRKVGARISSDAIEQIRSIVSVVAPSLLWVQLLFLVSWYLLLMLVWRSRRRSVRFFYVKLAVLIIIVMLLAGILLIQYRDCRYPMGIVVSKQVAVCAGPNTHYHNVGTLQEIDEVTVYDKRPGWYKIGTRTLYGWVPESAVHIV